MKDKKPRTKRGVSRDKGEALECVVLIGTYKGDQLTKWRGWYNYPISSDDKIGAEDAAKITELWLFKGTEAERDYKAEFVGVKTRQELIDGYGYPAEGKAHGSKYLLFKTAYKYSHKAAVPGDATRVIIRTSDFARRSPEVAKQLKAYLESPDRRDPDLAKRLPEIVTRLRPEQLRVCEEAVQLDFINELDDSFLKLHVTKAETAWIRARGDNRLSCVEICAGAGGQAIGLDMAGFEHIALVEYEPDYCAVLRTNRPDWNVICGDVHNFDGKPYKDVDLFAGGVPCPPFSVASKQLGEKDERDLFPEAIRLIGEIRPKAVMLENVRGFLDNKFEDYRRNILESIKQLGYRVSIKLLNASDYGVPQLRPRVLIVGIRNDIDGVFSYPEACNSRPPTVGETLHELMAAKGWKGADAWADVANKIAPTVVGGSKKHGGPDLGPARARRAWSELGVDGLGVANEAPAPDFTGKPKLTKEMLARIQGFPEEWDFGHRKTLACRMIGNAFPPPVALAVGNQIRKVLKHENT